jgi:hypothetical protein
VSIAGEHLTGAEYAADFSKVLGEEVGYQRLSIDAYRAFGLPDGDDIANTFQYCSEFEESFIGAHNLGYVRTFNRTCRTSRPSSTSTTRKFAA